MDVNPNLNTSHVKVNPTYTLGITDEYLFKYISC